MAASSSANGSHANQLANNNHGWLVSMKMAIMWQYQ